MKKILIALALCLVIVGLMAAPALAATQKVDLVKYAQPDPVKAGYATFTTDQGDGALVVGITLTSATPKTKYVVYLLGDCGLNVTLGYLKTNSKGKWGGQNEQYQFTTALSAGNYSVYLVLKPIQADGTPDEFSKTWVWGPPSGQMVTIRITDN